MARDHGKEVSWRKEVQDLGWNLTRGNHFIEVGKTCCPAEHPLVLPAH